MPGDVLVGTNQHELAAVKFLGRFQLQYLQRHAAHGGGGFERAGTFGRAEIDQGQPLAELVVGRALRRQPEMRCACAGAVQRRVGIPAVRRAVVIVVRPDDRRMLVALAELDADGEILRAVFLDDPGAEAAPRGVGARAVVLEASAAAPSRP